MAKKIFFIILSFVPFILAWSFVFTPAVSAAEGCITTSTSTCPLGQNFKCSYNNSGNQALTINACCKDSTACKDWKTSFGTGTRYGTAVNPEATCSNGINTALGCLPYKTEGGAFTSALLGFLAGIVGAISLIVMLMATIQIMTAGGNPEQVQKGKELFTGAVTGILFIIFSVSLLRLIAGDIIQLPGFTP